MKEITSKRMCRIRTIDDSFKDNPLPQTQVVIKTLAQYKCVRVVCKAVTREHTTTLYFHLGPDEVLNTAKCWT